MRYLKPSIHSVSACEPRPSAASIAALYPRIAWSLEMTSLVRGFSSRSARKPATASVKSPMSMQMSARCFAQLSCSSRLFMVEEFEQLACRAQGKICQRADNFPRSRGSGGRKSGTPAHLAVCHAGLVEIVFAPHALHRGAAGLWDRHSLGQGVDVDVGFMAAGFACRRDRADASPHAITPQRRLPNS